MTCYTPLKGFYSKKRTKTGKRKIVFKSADAHVDQVVEVPCGQCRGCRLDKSRQWAVRCAHEALMHQENSFITLTYSPENLPTDGSVHIEHLQKFIKRLRRATGKKIRYYACGEYGMKLSRPHYHLCVFGYYPPDAQYLGTTHSRSDMYVSQQVSNCWLHQGFVTIGDLTYRSAAYTARYCMKKISGEKAKEHYQGRNSEFALMSRRPGLGASYYEKFGKELQDHDYVVIDGKRHRVPGYYDYLTERVNPTRFLDIKLSRRARAERNSADSTDARLITRSEVHKLRDEAFVRDCRKKLGEHMHFPQWI